LPLGGKALRVCEEYRAHLEDKGKPWPVNEVGPETSSETGGTTTGRSTWGGRRECSGPTVTKRCTGRGPTGLVEANVIASRRRRKEHLCTGHGRDCRVGWKFQVKVRFSAPLEASHLDACFLNSNREDSISNAYADHLLVCRGRGPSPVCDCRGGQGRCVGGICGDGIRK
jgi:hypothetical protein